LAFQF